jgi:hypothetical protein
MTSRVIQPSGLLKRLRFLQAFYHNTFALSWNDRANQGDDQSNHINQFLNSAKQSQARHSLEQHYYLERRNFI